MAEWNVYGYIDDYIVFKYKNLKRFRLINNRLKKEELVFDLGFSPFSVNKELRNSILCEAQQKGKLKAIKEKDYHPTLKCGDGTPYYSWKTMDYEKET